MSILIKGMEMPTSCYKCPIRRRDGMDLVCPIVHERFSVADVNILEYRLDNCPLVPVQRHGRLIDADEISFVESENGCQDDYVFRYDINEMPTIIPAEEVKA